MKWELDFRKFCSIRKGTTNQHVHFRYILLDCLMLVVTKVQKIDIGSERFSFQSKCAKVVELAFWWSNLDADRNKAVKYFYGSERQVFFKELCKLAETSL